MEKELVAAASITIKASIDQVWNALVRPKLIKKYMVGKEVVTDWKVGSNIVWKGISNEKPYEDKGKILKVEPAKTLQYSYFTPLSGVKDAPENYDVLTYELSPRGKEVVLKLSHENKKDLQGLEQSRFICQKRLDNLKTILENQEKKGA